MKNRTCSVGRKKLFVSVLTFSIFAFLIYVLNNSQFFDISVYAKSSRSKVKSKDNVHENGKEIKWTERAIGLSKSGVLRPIKVEVANYQSPKLPPKRMGYILGREIFMVSDSSFPDIFQAYRGIIDIKNIRDSLFLLSGSGFAYKDVQDENWTGMFYVDTSDISPTVVPYWLVGSRSKIGRRIFIGGSWSTLSYIPKYKKVEMILDPTDVYGVLRNAQIVPIEDSNTIIAYKKNSIYFYDFSNSVIRKWSTPQRNCGFKDEINSVFTLNMKDEFDRVTYAVIKEFHPGPFCSGMSIQMKLFKFVFDENGDLGTTEIKELTSFDGNFFDPTIIKISNSEYTLYGNSVYGKMPYILSLDINTSGSQQVLTANSGLGYRTDFYTEERIDAKNKDYSNIYVESELSGMKLGSVADWSSTPQFMGFPNIRAVFANPYIESIGGVPDQGLILTGHSYLHGQFNNGLVTGIQIPQKTGLDKSFNQSVWFDGRGAVFVNDIKQKQQAIKSKSFNKTYDEYTVEMRVKWMNTKGKTEVFLGKKYDSYIHSIVIGKYSTDDLLHANIYDGQKMYSLESVKDFEPGKWYHIAIVIDNGHARLFLNGKLQDDVSFSNPISLSNEPYTIAAGYGGTAFKFSGMVDEFRVSNIARYKENFTLSNKPFDPDSNTNVLLRFDGNIDDYSPLNVHTSLDGLAEYINATD